jgi:hypothetical protein
MSADYEDSNMEEYEVESILDKKKQQGKWKYKIKWVGYPEDQCTWEPVENLDNVVEMLQEFEAEWAKKELKKQMKISNLSDSNVINSSLRDSNVNKKKEELKKRSRPDDMEEESTENTPQSKLVPLKKADKLRPPQGEKKKSSQLDAIILADEEACQIQGSLESDKPCRLITAKLNSQTNEVNCLVEWELRNNGVKPADSYVTNKTLRDKYPYLLLDFYESRLRFPPSNQEKK